jgi:hypothetical protein
MHNVIPLILVLAAALSIAAQEKVVRLYDGPAPGSESWKQKGGHGFGMRPQNLPTDHWIDRFAEWLDLQGLLKK